MTPPYYFLSDFLGSTSMVAPSSLISTFQIKQSPFSMPSRSASVDGTTVVYEPALYPIFVLNSIFIFLSPVSVDSFPRAILYWNMYICLSIYPYRLQTGTFIYNHYLLSYRYLYRLHGGAHKHKTPTDDVKGFSTSFTLNTHQQGYKCSTTLLP